jgi:hypothetical protein
MIVDVSYFFINKNAEVCGARYPSPRSGHFGVFLSAISVVLNCLSLRTRKVMQQKERKNLDTIMMVAFLSREPMARINIVGSGAAKSRIDRS